MALVIGLLGVLILAALAALAIWVLLAGQREGQAADDAPTLDVQNHIGDARRVR